MKLEINGPANIILGIDYIRHLLSDERYNEIFDMLDLMENDARTEIAFLQLISKEMESHGISPKTGWIDAKKCLI